MSMHLSRACNATIKMSKTTMRIIIRMGTEYTAFSLTKHITPSADPFLLVKYEYCKQFVMSQILFAFYVKTKNYGYIYTTCNAFFRHRYPNICNIQDINCIRGSQNPNKWCCKGLKLLDTSNCMHGKPIWKVRKLNIW